MANTKNIAVLVPALDKIERRTQAALGELVNRGYVVRTLSGCSQVDLARSSMASEALADGFTETFWIDSDTDFDPDDLERIRAHGKPFVAGLYVKKGRPESAAKFKADLQAVTFGVGGGLLEMEYVGFGFVYVKKEVYEAVARKFELPGCTGGYDPEKSITPYFLPMVIQEGERFCYLSEDYSFSHRARIAGFPPWADTTVRLGHISDAYIFGWEDLAPREVYSSLKLEHEQPKAAP